jgi:hypothetical protein
MLIAHLHATLYTLRIYIVKDGPPIYVNKYVHQFSYKHIRI